MRMGGSKRISVWAWPFLGLIAVYRYIFSPLLHLIAPGSGCRYAPTCSQYAINALRLHGAARGAWLSLRRILDCHPWGGHGYDPVPEIWTGWRFSRRRVGAHDCEMTQNPESSSLPRGR